MRPISINDKLPLARITRKRYLAEAVCWLGGIGLLATLNPVKPHVFSLCPFSWFLENGCPGCGLGHAIAFLFRGDWAASWEAHPLAVPTLLMLIHRVFTLVKNYFFLQSFYQKHTTIHG